MPSRKGGSAHRPGCCPPSPPPEEFASSCSTISPTEIRASWGGPGRPADTAMYNVHIHLPDGDIREFTHHNPKQGLKRLFNEMIDNDHIVSIELVHVDDSVLHITRSEEE